MMSTRRPASRRAAANAAALLALSAVLARAGTPAKHPFADQAQVLLTATDEAIRKQGLTGETAEAVRKGVAEGLQAPWAGRLSDEQVTDFRNDLPRYVAMAGPADTPWEDWQLRAIAADLRERVARFVGRPPLSVEARTAVREQMRTYLQEGIEVAVGHLGEATRSESERIASECERSVVGFTEDCLDPAFKQLVPENVVRTALKETRDAVQGHADRLASLAKSSVSEEVRKQGSEFARKMIVHDSVQGLLSRIQGALLDWTPAEVGEAYARAAEMRRKERDAGQQQRAQENLARTMLGLLGSRLLCRDVDRTVAEVLLGALWLNVPETSGGEDGR